MKLFVAFVALVSSASINEGKLSGNLIDQFARNIFDI